MSSSDEAQLGDQLAGHHPLAIAEGEARCVGGHHSPQPKTHDWLTPKYIVDELGPFDLDPCAAPHPRPWDTAARHITWPDDGLAAGWSGRVWLNPPYGQHVGAWLARLGDHGRGTALVFARTETEWFVDAVWRRAAGIVFLHGRLHFHYPDGMRAPNNAGGPSCLIAYGEHDCRRLQGSRLPGSFLPITRRVLIDLNHGSGFQYSAG